MARSDIEAPAGGKQNTDGEWRRALAQLVALSK